MRRNKLIFKWLLVGLASALIIFAISGCGEEKKEVAKVAAPEKKAEAEPAVDKGTLVFGRGGDSVGLDPAYETDGNSFMVCDNVFEALVFYFRKHLNMWVCFLIFRQRNCVLNKKVFN